MTIRPAQQAMASFLATSMPEVLRIEGRWGTGKTYAWNQAVEKAVLDNKIALSKYAYISLFGLKDSSDIIQAIFANTVDLKQQINSRKISTVFGEHSIGDIKNRLKKLTSFSAEHATVPYVSGLGGVARAVLAALVTKTIVCIDDFERKSGSISVAEIVGTITQLRDIRECKVVLILNENSLSEADISELQRYSEKVFNRSFKFLPTSAESVLIAFPDQDELSVQLRKSCETLGVVNIRVMEKIKQFSIELTSLMKDVDKDVAKGVIQSLVVIVWCIMSPVGEGAPNLAFLTTKLSYRLYSSKKEESTPEEDRWKLLLRDYGFNNCDEFDDELISAVQKGYFDPDALKPGIDKYLLDVSRSRARAAIEKAWEPFHASFDDNPTEVGQSIIDGYANNLKYVDPGNIDPTIRLLKETGFASQSIELLTKYMEANKDKSIGNYRHHPFLKRPLDPDVRAAFEKAKARSTPALPTVYEATERLLKGGWSPEDEEALASKSVEELITIFKAAKGRDRTVVIMGYLNPRKISSATARQRSISENAKAALIEIGRESPLNAHRLAAFEIELPPDQIDHQDSDDTEH